MNRSAISALFALLAMTAGTSLSTGCGDDNQPPAIGLVLDQQVTVGESLRLLLGASDPDGDRITFSAKGLPDGAIITARSTTEAVLVYSPLITDTEPGGRRYDVTVEASDGRDGVARQTFGLIVFPAFGVPTFDLPGGVVVNLAKEDDLSLLVEVKDDDSTEVTINLDESPAGARLQRAGSKSAFFYWAPDEAQREIAVHRAVLSTSDESHGQIKHVLTIVLLNAEKQAGCEGAPPTVTHRVPADATLAGSEITLSASIRDSDSLVQTATLFWTRGDPAGTYGAVLANRVGDTDQWSATIDALTAPTGGGLIHYYLTATDNDDPTGIACDQQARSPKTGHYSTAVYPSGTPASTCVDDPAEPDNSLSASPVLTAGTYSGRRLCGADTDLVRIAIPAASTLSASAVFNPAQGGVIVSVVNAAGATVASDNDADGDGTAAITYEAPVGAEVLVEISGTNAAARLSYNLTLGVDAVACEADANEPNGTPTTGTTLGEGTYPDQRICVGDTDFFRIAMAANQTLSFQIAFEDRYGDLDLELRDADGVSVLATAASEKSVESLTYTSPIAKTVVLRVYGADAARNDYVLMIGGAQTTCPTDGLGDNHIAQDAITLFQGIYDGFTVCQSAPDWYRVDLNGGETLEVLVETGDRSEATIAIYEDPAGSPVATNAFDGDLSDAVHTRATAGPLYYVVESVAAAVTYDILQDVSDPAGDCLPDRKEPNDTAGTATDLAEGVHTWFRLCGQTDVDVFAFEVQPFTTITALTQHSTGRGFTDVRLINPAGTEVIAVEDQLDGTYLEYLAETPGRYVLFVEPFDVQTTLGYDFALFLD
ncbi:MAG: hypothetical protein ACI9MR_003510 [Myxococcota bacterium]|jgi:hypothetical protein